MASSSNEFSNVSLTGETVAQKAYTIGGVPIIFPYKAYPSQISMMDKIVRCLNKKQNCLLESPTGSGKSLALLCAALAWLKKTGKEIREMENVLNKHLNAYGAAVADDANCDVESTRKSLPDFEKYKFKNHNSDKNNVKPEVSMESEISGNTTGHVASELTCNKSFTSTASESSIKTPSSDEKLRILTEKLRIKYPNDHLKKRGIIYIDLDDDLKDFQPMKKHKLFPDAQGTIPTATSQEECVCPTPDAELSVQQEHQYGRKLSETPNNNSSGYASSSKVIPENSANNSLPPKLPKIYFGTRTHKQIGQIIRELKKTPYKDVKMTILSSRERTCVHPKNSKSNNKNEGCDELIHRDEGPACNYYKNVKKLCYYSPPELSSAFDLEDFVSVCKKKQICPYYGAREILQNSEIVFCPYNYLVDPLIRSALNISLKNSVVIMDEAHNIEDSAREAASGCISVSQLQEAIADVLQIGQLKDSEESEPYMHIAKVLENLKKLLENSENLNEYVSFDSSSKVYSGDDMLAFLSYVGLGPDTFSIFQNHYTKICRDESEAEKEKTAEIKTPKLSGRTHIYLRNLTVTLNYMFKENLVYVPDYRCVVIKSKSYSSDTSVIPFSQASKRRSFASAFEITINFWCLNPSVAFSDMKDIHSLIVASGTLAPLTSFQSELGVTFHVTLEANHVINKEQVWVGTIGKGPSNNPLNGTFQSASTFAFQDDVGNLVLEVCSVIPHGVLCFLPSYGMLDKLASRWQVTGLWDQLLCKKVVVCEPRGANANFLLAMQEFYDAVKDSETDGCSEVTGALFFAVCRGKVSEGLDFADNNARAVITIGIPFPNVKDAHVDLKKKYNDMYASKRQIVTGSAWYEMQAFRALNQALGRCIRHRNDFGALIIVDERFQKYDRYISALSKWIKREIRHYSSFYEALNSLSSFAARMGLKNASTSE